MEKNQKKKSSVKPPSARKSDKVLRELSEKAEATLDLYNERLNDLHALYRDEPSLHSEDMITRYDEILRASGKVNYTFMEKLGNKLRPIINFLTPWNNRQRRLNELLPCQVSAQHYEIRNPRIAKFIGQFRSIDFRNGW